MMQFSYIVDDKKAGASKPKESVDASELIARMMVTGFVIVAIAIGTFYLGWLLWNIGSFMITSVARVGRSSTISDQVLGCLLVRSIVMEAILVYQMTKWQQN